MSGLPGRPKVFRDPVHGDIAYPTGEFQRLVLDLVNTELFQRLRNIRQNGVVCLVFHGAEHSRFGHSLGVAHVAAQMYDAARRNSCVEGPDNETDREETILAALLHDIGHGPFSHLIEEVLGRSRFDHEHMTVRILTERESEVYRLLDAYRAGLSDRLVPFVDKKARNQPRWFHAIVSSQLDADRLDYLARDARMAGVVSHHFDAARLISFLGVKDNELVVDARARDVLENYLLALDQMYSAIYYHHTVRCASQLVTTILQRAIDLSKSNVAQRQELFPGSAAGPDPLLALAECGHDVALPSYARLDEIHVYHLMRSWRSATDDTLRFLCRRLARREFPKHRELRTQDFGGAIKLQQRAVALFQRMHPGQEAGYNVTLDEASRLGYKRYSAGEGASGSIKVLGRDGRVQPIEELDRSVVGLLQQKAYFNRLMMPADVLTRMTEEDAS